MNNYKIKLLRELIYEPGTGTGSLLGVFKIENGNEVQIGEYERNYGTPYDTFFPFEQNGKELALYSPDYTATRIMELPSCKDLGGEEHSSDGFCPVEYFIPTYIEKEVNTQSVSVSGKVIEDARKEKVSEPDDKEVEGYTFHYDSFDLRINEDVSLTIAHRPLTAIQYYDFGFVAGCIWGDDGSWKIQYLDLSRSDNGVLKRDERFGYLALPGNVKLKEAIKLGHYERYPTHPRPYIEINAISTFNIKTGEMFHSLKGE